MRRGDGRTRRAARGYSASATLGVLCGLPLAIIAFCFVHRLPPVEAPLPYRALHGHTGWVNCVAWSGSHLATGSDDGTAIVWDAATGEPVVTLRGHTDAVDPVAFTTGGVVTASLDGTARYWSLPDGECRAIMAGEGEPLYDLAVVPATKGGDPRQAQLLTSGADGHLRRWSLPDGALLDDLRFGRGGAGPDFGGTATNHDGLTASAHSATCGAAGYRNGDIHLRGDGDALSVLTGHRGRIETLTFSPDGRRLASAASDNTVRVWNVATGQCLALLRTAAPGLHPDWIERHSVVFSPDGTRLATAQGYVARIYELPE